MLLRLTLDEKLPPLLALLSRTHRAASRQRSGTRAIQYICSFRMPRPVEVQNPDSGFRRLIGGTRRCHDLSCSLGEDAAATTSSWGRGGADESPFRWRARARRIDAAPSWPQAQPRHPALLIRYLDRPRRSLYRRSTRPAAIRVILRLIGSPAAGVCRCSCMRRAAIGIGPRRCCLGPTGRFGSTVRSVAAPIRLRCRLRLGILLNRFQLRSAAVLHKRAERGTNISCRRWVNREGRCVCLLWNV
jgi:hypothetical protein